MNCIQQNIKRLIYNKHDGFTTRLQRLFNIRDSISLIHFIDEEEKNIIIPVNVNSTPTSGLKKETLSKLAIQ